MCGIAGIIAKNEDGKNRLALLEDGIRLLKHRGPDFQQSIIVNESTALAHARLSIIDLTSDSNQPFTLDNKNYLVFNGEIFNYQKLKKEYWNETAFKTNSDTELVYRSIQKSEEKTLDNFLGFYSFAFYNSTNHELFLATDRIGVKPLYYVDHDNFFAFASELKPLIHLIGKVELDKEVLPPYLALTYSAGAKTMIKGIQRLLPGEYLKWSKNNFEIKKHYSISASTKHGSNFRSLFEDAVALRLVSDVPVGSFLSGGIDSTIVSALSAKLNPGMKTFSVGFKNQSYFDESSLAKRTAEILKTEHHELLIGEEDLLNKIDLFLDHLDFPFADSSALNVFALSEFAAKHVKVVLSGDGADEVFGGYNKHKALHWMQNRKALNFGIRLLSPFLKNYQGSRKSRLSNYARQFKKYHEALSLSPSERCWRLACWTPENELKKILNTGFDSFKYLNKIKSDYTGEVHNDLNSFFLSDVNLVLPFDMLVKVDRMSMAHGLEVRSPFLDYRVIESGLSLPVTSKISANEQKVFLKKTFSDVIPDFILSQPKRGFEIPLESWLRGPLRKRLDEDWMNSDLINEQGIFNLKEIKNLLKQLDASKSGEGIYTIWAILVFNHWWRRNFK